MTDELKSRRILITRSSSQASEFRLLLEAAGAEVVETPTIEILPRLSPELDASIERLGSYDWLMLTSINGARIFLQRASELGRLPFYEPNPRICTIGPATSRGVQEFGLSVDLTPARYQAEGVIEEFLLLHEGKIDGLRVLLPRASKAREILPEELRRHGAQVDVIAVYDTVLPEEGRVRLREALRGPAPDLVAFTSSSTVHNFVDLADGDEALKGFRYAAIGPITAATAAEYGLPVVLEPNKSTIPDLVIAIRRYFAHS